MRPANLLRSLGRGAIYRGARKRRTLARILIAEANPDNLDIFRTRLAIHGYEILTATDSEEALAIAREKQPDLILLDVMMA